MKWLLVILLSLALVTVCVVYLQRDRRPASLVPASVPAAPARPMTPSKSVASAPGPVDISGPLKDRGLVHWILPDYPDWAQEQGITGIFKLKIWVTPAGLVKSFTEVQQLSADSRLDDIARDAIRQWQFVEMPNSFGDQWGVVTVRFSFLAAGEGQPQAMLHGIALKNAGPSGTWDCVREWFGKEYRYYCKWARSRSSAPDK